MPATVAAKKRKSMVFTPDLLRGSRDQLRFSRIRVLQNELVLLNDDNSLAAVFHGDLTTLASFLDENYIYAGMR